MKQFIIFLLIVNIFSKGYSQNFINNIPSYMDYGITTMMVDSLNKHNVKEYLIFLTTMNKNQLSDEFIFDKDSLRVTYFIWQQAGETHVTLVTDSSVYKDVLISADTIFKYPYIDNTWLCNDENIYQVVSPILTPDDKAIVVYISYSKKCFFEIGNNVSYKLNLEKNKYRQEYIALLNKMLALTNKKWVKLSDYDRWIEFFPVKIPPASADVR